MSTSAKGAASPYVFRTEQATEQPSDGGNDFIFNLDESTTNETESSDRNYETERRDLPLPIDDDGSWTPTWDETERRLHRHVKGVYNYPGRITDIYTVEGSARRYGTICQADRRLREQYGPDGTIALLTFKASHIDGEGEHIPPLDHHDPLLNRIKPIRDKIDRLLESEWRYMSVCSGHTNWYTHVHFLLYIDRVVTKAELYPIIDFHVKSHPPAVESHHPYAEAIKLGRIGDMEIVPQNEHDRRYGTPSRMARYLAKNLPGIDRDTPKCRYEDRQKHIRMNSAVSWASDKDVCHSSRDISLSP